MKLNDYHRAILKDYADGDFAYLAEFDAIPTPWNLGDSLLTFILVELSDEEDCDTFDIAYSRMTRAKDDIDVVIMALMKVQEALLKKQAELV